MSAPVLDYVRVVYKSGGSYSRRAVEVDIIRYVDDVLADPDTSFSVALLVGSRLHGIRALLVQGVVARLRERDPDHAPTQCRGEWAQTGAIQFCVAESDVPPAPPPAGAAVCILLIACFDLDSLPGWMSAVGGPHIRTLPVGPLSLFEAHDFLEARLGGRVEPRSAHTLASLSGYTPHALAVVADECRSTGALESIDGSWVVLGDPVQIAIVPYLRAQLTAAGEQTALCISHLALTEPFSTEHLPPDVLELATVLLADGELRLRDDGRMEFTAPVSGEGLRRISSVELRARLFETLLRSDSPTIHSVRWAAATGREVNPGHLEAVAQTAMSTGDWWAAAEMADLSDSLHEPDTPRPTWFRLRLHAATGLRLLGDPAGAHTRLDEIYAMLPTLSPAEAAGIRDAARVIRADLLHFSDGDPGSALTLLTDCDNNDKNNDDDDDNNSSSNDNDPEAGPLLEHVFVHRVHAGRHRDAALTVESVGSVPRTGPHGVRGRVAAARMLLGAAAGAPQRALQDELRESAVLTAADATAGDRPRWVDDELRLAHMVTTLAATGPSAPGLLTRHPGAGEPGLHPDLAQAWYVRAEWHYTCGDLVAAHRHARIALEIADAHDPVGIEAATLALLAETSALLDDRTRARASLDRSPQLPARASAALAGTVHAHLAAARISLKVSDAGEALRRTASGYAAAGAFGFASDILYVGVRLGRRRAAADLCELSGSLDGNVHQLRVRHAGALLSRDAVELLVVVDDLRHAGLQLYAAEAAATAARMPSAPSSVRRRATHLVATHVADQPLPGHPLLQAVASPGAPPLTPREREVTALMDAGLSNAEIARRLSLSLSTVEGHITRIYRKTGGRRRAPARR